MRSFKATIYFFLLSTFLLLAAQNTPQQAAQVESESISLERYNTINNSIDSIESVIQKNQIEIDSATKDVLRNKEQRTKLSAECDTIKMFLKTNTSEAFTDSLQKANLKCDSLPERIHDYNKNISQLDTKISKEKQTIKILKVELELQREQLQREVKAINKIFKSINGSVTITFKGADYNIFIANSDSNEIKMHLQYKSGRNFVSIRNLHDYLLSQKQIPLMITNGGMYMPNLQPQGLLIAQKELHPIDLKSPKTDANFYLKPNGVFYIDTLGKSYIDVSEDFQKLYENKSIAVEYATQSGPMLVVNEEIHKSFTRGSYNRKIRSGVGIIDSKKTAFAISLHEANFYDFALLFRDILGCKDALFLDGAISQMYLKDVAPKTLGGQFGPLISVTSKSHTSNK